MLSPEPHPFLHERGPAITWKELMCQLLGLSPSLFYDNVLEHLADRLDSEKRMRAIVNLGLCSDMQVEKRGSPLNTLSHQLSKVLQYEKGERDMLLLRHTVRFTHSLSMLSV